jgi:hypothetical protein
MDDEMAGHVPADFTEWIHREYTCASRCIKNVEVPNDVNERNVTGVL